MMWKEYQMQHPIDGPYTKKSCCLTSIDEILIEVQKNLNGTQSAIESFRNNVNVQHNRFLNLVGNAAIKQKHKSKIGE